MARGQTPPHDRVAAKIERDERRRKATRLAVDGYTYEEIAEKLGYSSRQAAHRDVKAGMAPAAKALREEADHFIAVQTARLEQMHRDARKIFEEYEADATEAGDIVESSVADQRLAAMDRMLKVGESMRKLLGADAPTKTQATIDATVGYHVAVAPDELEAL
jgi:hypothetical protein